MANPNAPFIPADPPSRRRGPPKTSPSERPAVQVAFAKKAASAKAAKVKSSALSPDLIEANEQSLADEALATANRPAREHDERSVHAARGLPAQFRLLSKRDVLAIVNVSYPTLWLWMRQGSFPRSRVAGGRSVWRSDEVEAWLAALPVRKLKGDTPEALDGAKRQ
jgi:predicted DNA-binding transcriptional regulator AlpA